MFIYISGIRCLKNNKQIKTFEIVSLISTVTHPEDLSKQKLELSHGAGKWCEWCMMAREETKRQRAYGLSDDNPESQM